MNYQFNRAQLKGILMMAAAHAPNYEEGEKLVDRVLKDYDSEDSIARNLISGLADPVYNPVIVSSDTDASEANRLHGEAYGVDWKYEEPAKDRSASFDETVRPVIKWLNDNCHPHHTIVITPTHAELLEGQCSTGQILDYVKD